MYGGLQSADVAWALGDLGVGIMAWLNIIAIIILQKPALLALQDYDAQRRLGKEPQFKPDSLGISGADFGWSEKTSYCINLFLAPATQRFPFVNDGTEQFRSFCGIVKRALWASWLSNSISAA